MACPFPGMDPYIENPTIWGDFHNRFISHLCAALQPLLRPRYVALTQERLYVVESERPILPDVSVVRTGSRKRASLPGTAAVLELDTPAVFDLWREEVREPLIHIVEPAAEDRPVTAIEVLSPTNKTPGPGMTSYLQKREEFWESHTNLVEMDLLRNGEPTVRVSADRLASLHPWHYLVAVSRHWPATRQEVYSFTLQRRLPRIAIPLGWKEPDVRLDLQAVFTRCWDEGPYPELLRYKNPPPGPLVPDEVAWCVQRLREAGFRPPPRPRRAPRGRGNADK